MRTNKRANTFRAIRIYVDNLNKKEDFIKGNIQGRDPDINLRPFSKNYNSVKNSFHALKLPKNKTNYFSKLISKFEDDPITLRCSFSIDNKKVCLSFFLDKN
jgi:hypothetical protein